MDNDLHWTTAIAASRAGSVMVRGYQLSELLGHISFSEMIHLVMVGDLPTKRAARLLDMILVSAAESGPHTPSVLAARLAASCGAPVTSAAAAGAHAISKYHGGAVEDCMLQMVAIKEEVASTGMPLQEACRMAVRRRLDRGQRLGGFGHVMHKDGDPRVAVMLPIARQAGLNAGYLDLVVAIKDALEAETGSKLPINLDGAYAAILCEIGFPPGLANALFMLSRSVGMMAHAHEEKTRMRPRRFIHPTDCGYDGPPPRMLGDRD